MTKMLFGKKGFTLIELVIVIVVVGVMAAVGALLAVKMGDSFQYTIFRKDLSEASEVALRRMEREIRRLDSDTSVYTANATTYRFVDVDSNTIQFELDGTDLEREYNGTTDVLATNVSSFSFTYLDDDLATIASPQVNPDSTDIKFIQIDMTLLSGSNTVSYRAMIRLRNVTHFSDLFS
jgi:prepilin-type N-terminal cleavage/methylation domain-containing protein